MLIDFSSGLFCFEDTSHFSAVQNYTLYESSKSNLFDSHVYVNSDKPEQYTTLVITLRAKG